MLLYSNIIGRGNPFIILHGFLGMGDNWKTLGKKIADSNFEVHLIDQRNHGRSFHNSVFNYEVLVGDLKHYCNSHNLSDIVLLGHSMGGKTAMLFAAENPHLVSKLIVADISPRYYPVHHDAILSGLKSLDFELIKTRKEADETLSLYVSEFGIRQFLLKNLFWVEKGKLGLRINLKSLNDNIAEIGEALPSHLRYMKSTLFLKGDKSEYISLEDESIIKHHFPNGEIKVIKNAGHWLHAENPSDFLKQVLHFVM